MYNKDLRFHSIIDDENYIKSFGSKAFVCHNGIISSFYFDNIIFTFLSYFKLLRIAKQLKNLKEKCLMQKYNL